MARLPTGEQKVSVGCYYTLEPMSNMNINVKLTIKWYAIPIILWEKSQEEYEIKWYQYPKLILLIAYHSVMKWLGRN